MKKRKQVISFLIGTVFLNSILLNFSGCIHYISKDQLKTKLQKALEKRYHESFTCLTIWGIGGSAYEGECYPNNNQDVVFDATFYIDHQKTKLSSEKYASALASKEMSEKLSEQLRNGFSDCFVHAHNYVSTEPTDIETIDEIIQNEFSLTNFLKRESCDTISFYFTVCMNINGEKTPSYEKEYTLLNSAVEQVCQIGEQQGTAIIPTYWAFYLPADVYSEAVSYFDYHYDFKSDFFSIVEGKEENLNRHICIDYKDEMKPYDRMAKEPLSQERYVKLREEMDD